MRNHTKLAKMYLQQKRGQVTVFIILGIVILAAFGLFLLLRTQIVDLGSSELRRVTVSVPQEYQPVKDFLDSCLRETSLQAINLAGIQGGIIYPEENNIRKNSKPTEGDAVDFLGTSITIPYWYYLKSPNSCEGSCELALAVPKLRKNDGSPSIERELEKFIDRNIKSCLHDFSAFEQQGFIVSEVTQPKATVTIAKSSVNVLLSYDIKAESQDAPTTDIAGSYVSIPLNLERIYNLATTLTSYEQQYTYLEKHIINLIYGYSSLDNDHLPPPSDTAFDLSGGVSWQRSFVEQSLILLLEPNIRLLQVPNTRNFALRQADSLQQEAYLNRGTFVPVGEDNPDYTDYNVNFEYFPPDLGWDPYFNINCGSVCKPQSSTSNLAALVGIQRYKFFYDLSIPILVTIDSPDELKNELNGYKFQFALEANVRDNKAMKAEYQHLVASSLSTGSIGFCDPDKRNSGRITIKTTDPVSLLPVPEVNVIYNCVEESCVIGNTDASGSLSTKFPTCAGGIVQFQKEGYQLIARPLTINLDESKTFEQKINPLKEMKLVVLKKRLSKPNWNLVGESVALKPTESAVVTLIKKTEPTELDFSTTASYSVNEDSTLLLAPGKYELQISVIMNDKNALYIPQKRKSYDEEEVTLDEMAQDSLMTGGAKMTIVVSESDLNKNTITLYAVGIDNKDIKEHEDLEIIGKFNELSQRYAPNLQPLFT